MLTDSHCHLDFPDFKNDLDNVIERAKQAGVSRMVSIATTRKGLPDVRLIAENNDCVYYAFGMHPLHVDEEALFNVAELVHEAQHPKMIGIGETGLDYHYQSDTMELQKASLEIHIEAARQTELPLIIHSRDADDDMKDILTSEYKNGAFTCVMHRFSSGDALARAALDCGFYLSMSGVATFKNAESVRDSFRKAPIDQILLETDSPYLAPVPFRGKRNEPSYTVETAKIGASLFGLSFEAFAKITEENFERLFAKVTRS